MRMLIKISVAIALCALSAQSAEAATDLSGVIERAGQRLPFSEAEVDIAIGLVRGDTYVCVILGVQADPQASKALREGRLTDLITAHVPACRAFFERLVQKYNEVRGEGGMFYVREIFLRALGKVVYKNIARDAGPP